MTQHKRTCATCGMRVRYIGSHAMQAHTGAYGSPTTPELIRAAIAAARGLR
jgi:hypothetical protein